MREHQSKSKRYLKLIVLTSIFSIVLTIGISVAYMFRVSEDVQNEFERAVVDCQLIEEFNNTSGVKSRIAVKNIGNIDEYLRVKLVSYWVDENDEIIAKQASIPNFALENGWIAEGNNVYRYDVAIAPNDTTPNLFASGQNLSLLSDAEGNRQVIEVFAEAIQIQAIGEWE